MFHYNIRGGLGTQVLQFVNVYADALNKGLTDERLEITLNFGNYDKWFYTNPGNHTVDLDFLSALFDFSPFPIIKNKIGGVGIWALGYDNGYADLWDLKSEKFSQEKIETFYNNLDKK